MTYLQWLTDLKRSVSPTIEHIKDVCPDHLDVKDPVHWSTRTVRRDGSVSSMTESVTCGQANVWRTVGPMIGLARALRVGRTESKDGVSTTRS